MPVCTVVAAITKTSPYGLLDFMGASCATCNVAELITVTKRARGVMSAVEEPETKAGHLPAERVGGRRVVNKKDRRQSENEQPSTEKDEESREIVERDATLPAQMEKSYPTSGVRQMHDKPQPTCQPHYANPPSHVSGNIFQPKK
ncbi:hypothetical protein OESDEN_01316 [Oesophagostomum dentatum]|uniref:Uncharacterized protein n=1 Tax=Oesophagostomum dentatum TaxID=61180 RepID=A0A0B1TRI9_OESDE|nr:hypothetical protein OESDEN_01316 [Oesophagostomum dentatum]